MSDSPLLSVIIPVYNTERYLSRCLDSIINQDYKNLEIICVNDGSNDSSYNILLKYSEIDSRIKIINKKNKGAAIARNTALNIAAGTYITFVDSDDEIKENTYNTLLKYFSDDIDIVCFGTEEHTGDSISSPIKSSSYFFIERTSTEYITDNFIFSISKTIWNKIFRRDIIFKNNIIFPPYKAFEDNSFVVKYLLHIKKAYMVKEKFYIYYMRSGSIMNISNSHKEGNAINMIYILDDIFSYMSYNKLIKERISIFEHMANSLYRDSISSCVDYEQAEITAKFISILRKCSCLQDKNLINLAYGKYNIYINPSCRNIDIKYFCSLKGAEKVFSIVNYKNYKYICIFTKPVIRIKIKK